MVTRRSIAIRLDCYSPPLLLLLNPREPRGELEYVSRGDTPSSSALLSAFQDGISVHGYKYVPRVSPPPFLHEEEQEGPRIQINVYPVEGWWMERGNNFTWRCFRRLWKYESWRDDGCNERRWSRGKVWEAWAQRQRWVMSASLSWNFRQFSISNDCKYLLLLTFKTCNFQSMRIYSGV